MTFRTLCLYLCHQFTTQASIVMAENITTKRARTETQTPPCPEWPVKLDKNSSEKYANGSDQNTKGMPQANFTPSGK